MFIEPEPLKTYKIFANTQHCLTKRRATTPFPVFYFLFPFFLFPFPFFPISLFPFPYFLFSISLFPYFPFPISLFLFPFFPISLFPFPFFPFPFFHFPISLILQQTPSPAIHQNFRNSLKEDSNFPNSVHAGIFEIELHPKKQSFHLSQMRV